MAMNLEIWTILLNQFQSIIIYSSNELFLIIFESNLIFPFMLRFITGTGYGVSLGKSRYFEMKSKSRDKTIIIDVLTEKRT